MNIADKLTTIANNAQIVNEWNVDLEYTLDARFTGRTLQQNVNLLKTDKGNIVNAFKSKGANVVYDMPLGVLADEVETVYNKGYSQAESDFWDEYQSDGNRTDYRFAFAGKGWNDNTFKPKYDIKPIGNEVGRMLFYACNITDLREETIGVKLDFSGLTGLAEGLLYNNKVKYIGRIDLSNCTQLSAFVGASAFITIGCLVVNENMTYVNPFNACSQLENLTIEGTIGKNGFNVSWSNKLTHKSLMSIINALADKSTDTSGTTWTITLGNTNIAKLTEDEKNIIDTKGWVLK